MAKKIKIKPGKTQSLIGFFVGIVFCLIGILVAIPSAGLFGIFWTIVAVIITVSNGMNAFSDKGISTHEILIDESSRPIQEGQSLSGKGTAHLDQHANVSELKKDIQLRLKAAEELYQEGTITREEYEEKRKELLKKI